jgi:nucleoside-diphosphate-sugar epimerase
MTILVTGCGGFIGYAAANALHRAGRQVIGYDLGLPAEGAPAWPIVFGDLGDAHRLHDAMRRHGVMRVLHLGAASGPMVMSDNPAALFALNVGGTVNVFEAARQAEVERVVFLSSNAAYGPDDGRPIAESQPLLASEPYGASKVAGEAIMRAYHWRFGLDAVALRVGVGYGPRRVTTSEPREILANALDGRPTAYAWGIGYRRLWTYLDDIVGAIIAALDAKPESLREPLRAYNVAGAEFAPLEELAAIVRELVPGAEIRLGEGWSPEDVRRGPLLLDAAKRDLGWAPKIGVREGLTRYRDWMRSRNTART